MTPPDDRTPTHSHPVLMDVDTVCDICGDAATMVVPVVGEVAWPPWTCASCGHKTAYPADEHDDESSEDNW